MQQGQNTQTKNHLTFKFKVSENLIAYSKQSTYERKTLYSTPENKNLARDPSRNGYYRCAMQYYTGILAS